MFKLIKKKVLKNKNIFTTQNNLKYYSNKSENSVSVLNGGLYTLVQDFPGRQGYWRVGVSPSGPMDSYSFRVANKIVGNSENAAGLEMTYAGSTLKFNKDTVIALSGASMQAELDGKQIPLNEPVNVKKGQTLVCSNIDKPEGARSYLAIRGGINVPDYLGSKSTFPLGKFGGFEGRELRAGDNLEIGGDVSGDPKALPEDLVPKIGNDWEIKAVGGPQDLGFLTEEDVKLFYESTWTVSHNASRLGVRLDGPKMKWARPDGGEGGSHPSNLHDNAYSVGSINFTGDHPVILTADGPSLGGFVCPATIPSAELWKVGQLKPGDKIRFKRISVQESVKLRKEQDESIKSLKRVSSPEIIVKTGCFGMDALSFRQEANGNQPSVSYRFGGDNYVLVEYGEPVLDLNYRVRIHALEKWLREHKINGLIDTIPGVRSLLLQYDSQKLPPSNFFDILKTAEKEIGNLENFKVKSRILHLPMAFRDKWSLAAISKYQQTVRDEAPYLPDNIDFIAANNGISSEEVRKMIFDTSYMVLGLGDVYLGAPCAVPMDPRQRLVVPKYNPARTFTPEGTVGIGGTYMCIYGMDSPGGYQLIGRTLPIWNTKGDMPYFSKDKPWLLDMFDQVRYYQVSDDEVDEQRNQFRKGKFKIKIEEEEFDVNKYTSWVKSIDKEVQKKKESQKKAQSGQLRLDEEMQSRAQEKRENLPKILNYLGEMAVNGPSQFHPGASSDAPSKSRAYVPKPDKSVKPGKAHSGQAPPRGFKNIFEEEGPEGFAKAVRKYPGALLTDTTWRDAHQSLLATRVRTKDLLEIAHATSHVLHNAYSIECWGGATFDVALRFLHECPWDRLAQMRELVPNVPFQMLLRGANAVGYTSYPDNVVYKFCKKAKDHGMDVFRVFDSLNYIDNMRLGIDAVGESGGIIEAAICYSGDVADPTKTKYTLDYYMDFAQKLVKAGIHVLCVKDMAGLLRPSAARILISALRKEYPEIPIHVHTHDTSGTGVASMLECIHSGADAVDCASDAMSGLTSQPAMGPLVNELRNTGIDHHEMLHLTRYWEGVRRYYAPFESGQKSAGSDVYINEIPGGQYTNMLFQALSLGLHDEWDEIKNAYHQANLLLGDIIKVTPSSKTVGDLAQFMVNNKLTPEDVIKRANELNFPSSTVEFFRGLIGHPYGGFPEPLRTGVLKGRFETVEGRPGQSMEPLDFQKVEEQLVSKYGRHKVREEDVVSYSQYPKVFEDYMTMQSKYGKITRLPTNYFLAPLEIGETVEWDSNKVTLTSISPINEEGNPNNGSFNVNFESNGKPVSVPIKPSKKGQEPFIISRKGGKVEQVEQVKSEKADKSNSKHVPAPMPGKIQEIKVKVGDSVNKGDPILIINSMKMETIIGAPTSGKVKRIICILDSNVSSGDLLLEME